MKVNQIIKKPLMTEKATAESEKRNRYGFVVNIKANKNQVKEAIERLFDVKVIKVWSSISPGKLKRAGKSVKKTPQIKKVYVQIADGQKIEFFKGI